MKQMITHCSDIILHYHCFVVVVVVVVVVIAVVACMSHICLTVCSLK